MNNQIKQHNNNNENEDQLYCKYNIDFDNILPNNNINNTNSTPLKKTVQKPINELYSDDDDNDKEDNNININYLHNNIKNISIENTISPTLILSTNEYLNKCNNNESKRNINDNSNSNRNENIWVINKSGQERHQYKGKFKIFIYFLLILDCS
jgi:beta-xylosidase